MKKSTRQAAAPSQFATSLPEDLPAIRRALLRWYDHARRDLPWRRTADPYRIWVSEIMLQQTRVEAVIPYYRNFLRLFPTVNALAKAPQEHVLAAWSGLGYYSRARNLQRAAQAMVERHKSSFPRDESAALALPGVGRYTAAAVLSIAYGVPLAVLDGNVARVLSRLLMVAADVRDAGGRQQLWELAEQLLDPRRSGDFNQAMMELGATVCVPGVPRCMECPLAKACRAHIRGVEDSFPPARQRLEEAALELVSAIVRDDAGRLLLEQRHAGASWMAGFWQIPTWELSENGKRHSEHCSNLRARLDLGRQVGQVRHSITRFRIVVQVREAALVNNALANGGRLLRESASLRWAAASELSLLPVSTITRKALQLKPEKVKAKK